MRTELPWVPRAFRTDADWDPPGDVADLIAGTAHVVEYQHDDQPESAVILYLYPAWHQGKPGQIWIQYAWEWIHGDDPAEPVGTEVWTASGHADLPGHYPSEDDAGAAAGYLAAALARCEYTAVAVFDPDLYLRPLQWDGIPRETEPAAP